MKQVFKSVFLLLFLAMGSSAFAQKNEQGIIDSMQRQLQNPKLGKYPKALIYEEIGLGYNLQKEYDSAILYFTKALALHQEGGNDEGITRLATMKKQTETTKLEASNRFNERAISGGVLLLFIIIIMVLVNKSKKQRQSHELLFEEKKKSEELLLNILPEQVAKEIREKGMTHAQQFDNVTVIFTDFVSFTTVAERFSPNQLVGELHACFKAFDELLVKCNIEKIKTVGDAYLAVAGLPTKNKDHAMDAVTFAIHIRNFMKRRKDQLGDATFQMRIGIHTGGVIAGIVGAKKYAYDIWGDTVNTAARMEQNSEPGKINISQTTYDLVKDKFECHYRGEIEAKKKGKLKMYFVD